MVEPQQNIVDMPLEPCECCNKRVREDVLISFGDVTICPKCAAEWQAEIDACAHVWGPEDHFYDGRVCEKCGVIEP